MTPRGTENPERKHIFSKELFICQRDREDGNPIDPSPSDGKEIKQAGSSSCLSRIESQSLQAVLGKHVTPQRRRRRRHSLTKWPIHGSD